MESGCSIRQERFVEAILAGNSQGSAYIQAGYTAKNGAVARTCASRLLTKANVQGLLNQRRIEMMPSLQAHTEITREYVLKGLKALAELASQPRAIKSEGRTIILWQPNAACRALELLGRECPEPLFIERRADVTEALREREANLALLKKARDIIDQAKRNGGELSEDFT